MKLGLSSYTFGWAVGVPGHPPANPLDEHGLLERVMAHELKLLQIGDNLPLSTFETGRLKALRDRAESEGIELELGARGLTSRNLATYSTVAQLLGARLIRFVIDDKDYHPTMETIISTLRLNLSSLDGLQLALENHDRFKAAEFRHIVDSVNAPNIGICLDTANSLGAGEGLETVVGTLAPVTFNLHIKDFEVKRLPYMMGFTVAGCPTGRGLVDVPSLLKSLSTFGRCRTAILEQWTPPEKDIERTIVKENEWASESLSYLKAHFA